MYYVPMKHNNQSPLAKLIRDRRKALKLSQQDLASKIGKNRFLIFRAEKGQRIFLDDFVAIITALGLDICQIIPSSVSDNNEP
jgi:transcriptional regulator with XRE-family HTH domain